MADKNFFYKKADAVPLKELVFDLEHEIVCENGDVSQFMVKDAAPLARATKDEISFFSNIKYKEDLKNTSAGVIILEEENLPLAPENSIKILSSTPYLLYAKIVARLYPNEKFNHQIANSAIIDASAKIGENCYIGHGAIIEEGAQIGEGAYIGPHAFIGKRVIIGKNTVVKHNCTLEFCHIGDNCLFHPGVRIGQDGFGFVNNEQGLIKVKQLGRVVIGNYVEIGANSCIDRGALDDTIIADGTKIDNLVQIGHNVTMGRSCIVVSQVGIAGSTKIGDGVVLGGQVGVSGHISIGSGAMLAAKSGVVKDVEAKAVMGGFPAVPIRQWHRQNAILREMAARKETDKN